MTESREAFDLFSPSCRDNFWRARKWGQWGRWDFWKLVWSDTRNRVCFRPSHD